jgi:hypothetical protein
MRLAAVVFLALLLLPVVAIAGPLEDGEKAFERHDYQTALKLWQPLADQGDARAENNIALMYLGGAGVTRDYAEAMKWYLKAARAGNAAGQFMVGQMNERGQGVPRSLPEMMKWYRRAAEQGFSPAQYKLGWAYERGWGGVTQDYAEAYFWDLLSQKSDSETLHRPDYGDAAAHLTTEQRAAVAKRVKEWKPSPAQPPAPATTPDKGP